MSDNSAHCPFFLSSLPTVVNTSNHPSAFTPSQMTEQNPKTIMPALLDNKATKVSDSHPNQKPQASSQSLMNSDRSTHWPDLQCPVTFDQTSQGSELEISTEHLTERSIKQDDAWNYVSHQRPPSYASCSFAYNSNFCLDQGLGMYPPLNSMIQLCGLPLPNGPSQRSGAPRAPAYDAAPSLAPSLYATASNLRTPNWANIHDVLGGRRNDSAIMDSDDSDGEGNQGEPPYASLIYQALMEAPNHQMVLKEIYEWIAQNTDKARDPAFKGWQNSVRHNLSMNGVCLGSKQRY